MNAHLALGNYLPENCLRWGVSVEETEETEQLEDDDFGGFRALSLCHHLDFWRTPWEQR